MKITVASRGRGIASGVPPPQSYCGHIRKNSQSPRCVDGRIV